jgi:hypothetical protein
MSNRWNDTPSRGVQGVEAVIEAERPSRNRYNIQV